MHQRDRDRLIDDGKRGKQNRFTQPSETIYTISVDWIAEVLMVMSHEIAFEWAAAQARSRSYPPSLTLPDGSGQ